MISSKRPPLYVLTNNKKQKKMNKHKKFIKDAYNGNLGLTMCSDWKQAIEEAYPEFKETKLEVGKWYNYDGLLICFSGNYGNHTQYGFTLKGEWNEKIGCHENDLENIRLATDQEVKEALIKEAEKRYENKKVECLLEGIYEIDFNKGFLEFREDSNSLCLYSKNSGDGVWVFEDGKWAEIVQTITKEEAEKQLGKKIV